MRESIMPRSGEHPVTGEAISPIESSVAWANSINGHEWSVTVQDDLQYACIFPLPDPRDCSTAPGGCDCDPQGVGHDERPTCQSPETGDYGAIQYAAKTYPGIRHLEVLEGFAVVEGKSIPASLCARNLSDDTRQDFGYRPFAQSLVRLARQNLVQD
jgi:hypothetical protein